MLPATCYSYIVCISGAPQFKNPDQLKQVVASPAGRTVKMQCHATGFPEPQVEWWKDGELITAEKRRPSLQSYTVKTWALILEDAVASDTGRYKCRAFNKFGSISHIFSLKIVERLRSRPIIGIDYPKNATVLEGQNVTFECPVHSDLHPFVLWFRHLEFNGSYLNENGTAILMRAYEMPVNNWRRMSACKFLCSVLVFYCRMR